MMTMTWLRPPEGPIHTSPLDISSKFTPFQTGHEAPSLSSSRSSPSFSDWPHLCPCQASLEAGKVCPEAAEGRPEKHILSHTPEDADGLIGRDVPAGHQVAHHRQAAPAPPPVAVHVDNAVAPASPHGGSRADVPGLIPAVEVQAAAMNQGS